MNQGGERWTRRGSGLGSRNPNWSLSPPIRRCAASAVEARLVIKDPAEERFVIPLSGKWTERRIA